VKPREAGESFIWSRSSPRPRRPRAAAVGSTKRARPTSTAITARPPQSGARVDSRSPATHRADEPAALDSAATRGARGSARARLRWHVGSVSRVVGAAPPARSGRAGRRRTARSSRRTTSSPAELDRGLSVILTSSIVQSARKRSPSGPISTCSPLRNCAIEGGAPGGPGGGGGVPSSGASAKMAWRTGRGDHGAGQWIAVVYPGHGGQQPLEVAGTAQASTTWKAGIAGREIKDRVACAIAVSPTPTAYRSATADARRTLLALRCHRQAQRQSRPSSRPDDAPSVLRGGHPGEGGGD